MVFTVEFQTKILFMSIGFAPRIAPVFRAYINFAFKEFYVAGLVQTKNALN